MNYTSVEQSKKLLELGLSPESADMYYSKHSLENYYIPIPLIGKYSNIHNDIPCWSLAALLSIIPKHINNYPKHIKNYNMLRIDISDNDFAIWYDEIGYGVNDSLPNITMESAVDACVEMIMRLHELNLL